MRKSNYLLAVFLLASLVLFASCGAAQSKVEEKDNAALENLDGYWILTNYVDEILKSKSIAPHTRKPLTWDAIILKIHGDSLVTHGLIMGNTFRLTNKADSLTTITGLSDYQLSYNSSLQQIRATEVNAESGKADTLVYSFRRVLPNEQRLIAGIDGKRFFENLESNFYSFFIDSLISGTYEPLTKSTERGTLVLGKAQLTSGFKNYTKYVIHDYFGTLHPFRGYDAIIFEDTTLVSPSNTPPTNEVCYNWRFNGDTLVLTELLTETYDSYFLGTKTFKLLRIN